jgi:hypothetical protein
MRRRKQVADGNNKGKKSLKTKKGEWFKEPNNNTAHIGIMYDDYGN